MRHYLLFLALLTTGMFASAQKQESYRDNKLVNKLIERPATAHSAQATPTTPRHQHRAGRALPAKLNSQLIGSAGNLLTIIEGNCNQIDVDSTTNAVIFIHRNDPVLTPNTNVAQYRYDISKDGGATWTPDIGPITNDPSIDNVSINGRFPQAVIYNPAGNTNVDSAYLVYSGTWHDNNTWSGQMRGRGKLSGDISTYNVHIDPVNNKQLAIATGMCKGAPGVFWNLNTAYSGGFNQTATALTTGLVVQKGVWNTTTKDVDWTSTLIPQTFATQTVSGTNATIATAYNIAFDPTGQKGWIALLGDLTADNDSVYDPIFWRTIDGGNNWTGPIRVDLDSLSGIIDSLHVETVNGDPSSLVPSTTFEADLSVDVNGNPHLLTTVGNGGGYSIEPAGYDVWDITIDTTLVNCSGAGAGGWVGIHLADINTLRGDFTNDAPPTSMDNRPLTSRSADGKKIFFFWLESDIEVTQTYENSIPNLFGVAIDVVAKKMTRVYNITAGDSLWGGETVDSASGVFAGATFPTVAPIARTIAGAYNVPLVLTQIDYNHDPAVLGSSESPAAFWYINNVDFAAADFNKPLNPPVVTLNGPDSIIIRVNTSYTEDSATAFDCADGNIGVVIQNKPNLTVVGIYNVLYIATNSAGNSDTVIRTVIVGDVPVADFNWTFANNPQANRVTFNDLSINFPQSWIWDFGDGSASIKKQPTLKIYQNTGTYNVCLTVANTFGTSSKVCKEIQINQIASGINDVELDKAISLFPNPSNGKAELLISSNNASQLTVTVYNIMGEVIISPVTYKAGVSNIQLDLGNAASGLYLVKIQGEKGATVKQLTINNN